MTEKILFVDDEPNILQSIKRQLRKRFDVTTAESGAQALDILKTEGPFAVIVSDMRMPEMTGVELLSRVKDLYPDMTRIMLTGNADQETAVEAVNTGQIFRFLTKPCPPAMFIPSLALALRQYRLVMAEKEILQTTLTRTLKVMSELLGIANPLAFSAGRRVQEIVLQIADALGLSTIWEFEIAAVLSQIGCITLPNTILEKLYRGQDLSEDEIEMFNNHPYAGASFLEQIPRLENITKIVRFQQMEYAEYTEEFKEQFFEEVIIGAQMLKVALDLDKLLYRGVKVKVAINELKMDKNRYSPDILAVLLNLDLKEDRAIISTTADKVLVGMIAVEDIIAKNGVLMIPKGQVITKPLKEGLVNFRRQVGIVEPVIVCMGDDDDEES